MLRMKIRNSDTRQWITLPTYLTEDEAVGWIVVLVKRFPDIEIDFV
jgi:hypothetical protein